MLLPFIEVYIIKFEIFTKCINKLAEDNLSLK
jgi:hypothetical protein